MPKYRLHYFPESGNSYKLALMLTLCGESFDGVWTDFAGGATRTVEWRRDVNPMGEIPVLEIDGKRFTQTAPLLLKFAEQYGRFGAETEEEKFELLRWLFWDNHKLTGYMATYRFMRTFTVKPDEHVLKHFRRRLDDFLSILEQHLQTNAFAIGARLHGDDRDWRREPSAGLLDLDPLRSLVDHHDPRAREVDELPRLRAGERWIDADGDPADRLDRDVELPPLPPRLGRDRDRRLPIRAELEQRGHAVTAATRATGAEPHKPPAIRTKCLSMRSASGLMPQNSSNAPAA